MLISHSVDGVYEFWDINSGKEFFEHIILGEKDWMVKNPEGYFNGTDNARKYVHFVNGMKTYSVDQFLMNSIGLNFYQKFSRTEEKGRVENDRRKVEEFTSAVGKDCLRYPARQESGSLCSYD
jgi:hypothetical protein